MSATFRGRMSLGLAMSKCRNIYRKRGTGTIRKGYLLVGHGSKQRPVHIAIAEKALGRPLPPNAVVHHVDDNGLNNTHTNLVICQDQAYHMLLHARQRAYDACGHAEWRKCTHCQKYDALENLLIRRSRTGDYFTHGKRCQNIYARARRCA